MNKRSIGITIAGWTEVLIGLLGILFSLAILFSILHKQEITIKHNFLILVVYFLPFVVPVSLLIFGNGLLSLRKWAWRGNVFVLPWVSLVMSFVYSKWNGYGEHDISGITYWFFGLLFVLMMFLVRNNIREQFNNSDAFKQPVGVIILGWLEIILGLFFFVFVGLASFPVLGYAEFGVNDAKMSIPEILYFGKIFIVLFLHFSIFIVGLGILRMRKWAWFINLFFFPAWISFLIIYVPSYLQVLPRRASWILINIMVVTYSFLPHVRKKFFVKTK